MTATINRLRKLHATAVERNFWPLACALTAALSDETNIDCRINVVGAMHEVGLLRNSFEPLWTLWRSDSSLAPWLRRCLERLLVSDHDYWALAGLLGLHVPMIHRELLDQRFHLLSIRCSRSPKHGDAHIATYCLEHSDRIIYPVIEVGWQPTTGEVVEAFRWRAVILEKQENLGSNLVAEGSGSYFLQATLPYGSWRLMRSDFSLRAECALKHAQTMLGDVA